MRLATLIIGLVLMLVIGLQSCAGAVGGALGDEALEEGAGVGFVVTVTYLLGAAFAIGQPKVSLVIFAIGGALALIGGATTAFTDLVVWGIVALGLAVMSYFGHRELLGKKASAEGADG